MRIKVETKTQRSIPKVGQIWKHPDGEAVYMRVDANDMWKDSDDRFYSVSLMTGSSHVSIRTNTRGFLIAKEPLTIVF